MRIEDIDQNFLQHADDENLVYINCRNAPVQITGFPWLEENGNFHRLPDKLKHLYSNGVRAMRKCTSGGAVRFRSNTHVIGLKWELEPDALNGDLNVPPYGMRTFDVYSGSGEDTWLLGRVAVKSFDGVHCRGALHISHEQIMREITINFPLYTSVAKLELGFDPDAVIEDPTPFKYDAPVVFYGSSITQGGTASRPGLNYTTMLARKLCFEQVNLGFSGSAKGEATIAEIISKMKMSAFVMDYDHNANKVEILEETHGKFFRIIREANPDLPIIMISRPNVERYPDKFRLLRDVILRTYGEALAAGDKNVYFIDGASLFGEEDRFDCTDDNVHPNDLGFYRMYRKVLPVLKEALENRRK